MNAHNINDNKTESANLLHIFRASWHSSPWSTTTTTTAGTRPDTTTHTTPEAHALKHQQNTTTQKQTLCASRSLLPSLAASVSLSLCLSLSLSPSPSPSPSRFLRHLTTDTHKRRIKNTLQLLTLRTPPGSPESSTTEAAAHANSNTNNSRTRRKKQNDRQRNKKKGMKTETKRQRERRQSKRALFSACFSVGKCNGRSSGCGVADDVATGDEMGCKN